MSLSDPSGFAVRRNGSCLPSEKDCGYTAVPYHACCPAQSFCPKQFNINCCPTSANCTSQLVQSPYCADSKWTLYDNGGYFCCPPDKIGYAQTLHKPFSDGCADAGGGLPDGARLLSVVSAGQTGPSTKTSTRPSTSSPTARPPDTSSGPNIGAIVGGVVGGIAVVILLIVAVLLYRRRTAKKGSQPVASHENDVKNDGSLYPQQPMQSDAKRVNELSDVSRQELADTRPVSELP